MICHLKCPPDTPFESIESAQEFLKLLATAVLDAKLDVEAEVRAEQGIESRRLQARRLIVHKLDYLQKHIKTSQRLLNDLRSLRRLLLQERSTRRKGPEADTQLADALELDGAC